MTTTAEITPYQGYQRSGSGLADVIDLILEKGMVIDVYVRVSLVGIELLTVDARIVVASVDTYLRFAQACNRLDIARSDPKEGLPQIVEKASEGKALAQAATAFHSTEKRLEEIAEQKFHELFGHHRSQPATANSQEAP